MSTTIISKLIETATQNGGKTAAISGTQTITYSELLKNAVATSAVYKSLGVKPKDRIVLSASSSEKFIYAYVGTHLANAIAVPVDPQLPDDLLKYIIRVVEPKIVITKSSMQDDQIPIYSFEKIIDNLTIANGNIEPQDPDEVADILFTTGTTGLPKGVVLSHRNIFSAAHNINLFIQNDSQDTEVIPLPLSHSFGLGRLRCNLLAGGSMILVDGFTFIGKVIQAIENHNATGLSAVPAGIAMLLKMSQDKLSEFSNHLKYIEIGSAPMPYEHKLRLMKLLPNTRICMHFGLTEASRAAFIEFHESAKKIKYSIGKPSPNVQIKIVGKDNKPLTVGKKGKIVIKGPMVMQGYYQNNKLTQKAFEGEWLNTGDIGHIDNEGYYYLDGREKELINVGGRKVSPVEVENLLVQHPDIKACACVGIADPKKVMGEVVKAFIVLQEGVELPDKNQLMRFLKGKLEPYKLPVDFERIASIPTTQSGKILRLALKELNQKPKNEAN